MTEASHPLPMDPRQVSHPIQIVLRLVLAGIFLYAAVPKLLHPDQFAENVLDYALLPVQWVNLLAIWLPAFELVVGIMVLAGIWIRASALSMIGMGVIFLGGLVWVQSGPTPLPCSCFSTDPGAEPRTWLSLWQEAVLVLLALALWVSHWPPRAEPLIHMRKRQAIGLLGAGFVIVLLMVGVVVARHQRVAQPAAQVQQEEALIATAKPLPRLLDLGSLTCEACQEMAPALEELTRELEGKVIVQFVDIDQHAEYVASHDLVAIPTQIFFDVQGRQVGRHEGDLTKAEALEQLQKFGLL